MTTDIDIRRLREQWKLSQQQLADKLGVPKSRLAKWEERGVIPKKQDVDLVQRFFDYEISQGASIAEEHTIPYYPEINASAGMGFLTENGDKNITIPIRIPNVDAQAFINVFGDSMYPKFCSGEIIGVKQVEKDFVMFGQAYVVQMKDGEAYIKYILPGKDEHHWVLDNENPKYHSREFHLSKIDKVFLIKAIITKTTLL
jgi:phage repressor protein C with HTH and peptisase S24 domain